MADGLSLGIDAGQPGLELNTATHVEHVEIIQLQRDVFEFPFRRKVSLAAAATNSELIALRHQFKFRLDVLVGNEEVHGRRIDRLVDGEIPFGGLGGYGLG